MDKEICDAAYIVLCDGPMILGGYKGPRAANNAHIHSRTITGASVVMVQLLDTLPEIVRDALGDDFDDQPDTPVTEVPLDDVEG